MKKRDLRRHQQWVAKLRHVRIIWRSDEWAWKDTPFNSLIEQRWSWSRHLYRKRPWQQVSRCTMNGEPKAWQYHFNIRPSRIRSNQLLRGIERGRDPDCVQRWPDYRKPHIYFW